MLVQEVKAYKGGGWGKDLAVPKVVVGGELVQQYLGEWHASKQRCYYYIP